MSEIIVYGPPQSTYVRTVRMLCEEKNAPYELQAIEMHSRAHRALHPFTRVPVCRCDGELLYETGAICTYLNAVLPGPSLVPARPLEQAHMQRWMSIVSDYAYPTMIRELVLPRVGRRKVDDSVMRDALAESVRQLALADDELASRAWLAGAAPSLADLYLAPIVAYLMAFPDVAAALADKPNLQKWFAAIGARRSFAATAPPQG